MPVYRIRLRTSAPPMRALSLLQKYGIVLGYETEQDGELTAEMIEADLASEALADLPDGRGSRAGERFGRTAQGIAERDADIVRLYQEDPRANSSEKLAVRFGISRERVCQVLRRDNTIEHVAERRLAAKEALADETAAIRAQVKAEFNNKIERALELVKGGESIRAAALHVGFDQRTTVTNLLGRLCKQRGIAIQHGPHRDFSARRARALELIRAGHSVPRLVKIMRSEGDRVFEGWVYRNIPEARLDRRQPQPERTSE